MEATLRQIKFLDHQWMQQAGKVSAGRHADARKGLFDGTGAADAGTAFEYQHALAGTRQVGCASEAVMTGADDDGIPAPGGKFEMGSGRPISPRTAAVGDAMVRSAKTDILYDPRSPNDANGA